MFRQRVLKKRRPDRHTVFNKTSRRPLYYEDVYGKYNEENDAEGGAELCDSESESESESEGEVVNAEKGREAQNEFKQPPRNSKRKRTQSNAAKNKRPRTASKRDFGLFGAISPFKPQGDLEEMPQFTMEGPGNLDDGFPVLGEDNMDQEPTRIYGDQNVPENFLSGLETFAMRPSTNTVFAAVPRVAENIGSKIYNLEDMQENPAEDLERQHSNVDTSFSKKASKNKHRGRVVIKTMPTDRLSSAQDLLTQPERAAINRVAAETPGAQLAAVLDDILKHCPACAQIDRESVSIAQLHSHAQIQLLERMHERHKLDEADREGFHKASKADESLTGGNVSAEERSRTRSRIRELREKQQSEGTATRPKTRAERKALLRGPLANVTKGLRSSSSRRKVGRHGGAAVVIRPQ